MSQLVIFLGSFVAGLLPGLLMGMRLEQRHQARQIARLQQRVLQLESGQPGALTVDPAGRILNDPAVRKEAKKTAARLQGMQKKLSKRA